MSREATKLVVVESPGKIKKISSFLPPGYRVVASYGHVRDLPDRDLGISFEGDKVIPSYQSLRTSAKHIKALKAAADNVSEVLLATDPDREGEAIAWHVRAVLGPRKFTYTRIEFNEITKSAVQKAITRPRELDMARVNAQQARRLLDRLVGWGVSPFCWQRLGSGTSAGRVQSVAVRLVAERELEIRAFVPVIFHDLWAWLRPEGIEFDSEAAKALAYSIIEQQRESGTHPALFEQLPPPPPGAFKAKLIEIDAKAVKQHFPESAQALEHRDALLSADWRVESAERSERKRRPPPPFITSTLQQAATNRYKLSPRATMQAAQKLYEAGLITYMRTDSPSISGEAIAMSQRFIEENLPPELRLGKPRFYSAKKGSGAQEAHECIRPTDINALPKSIEARMKGSEGKVYRLIWERFLASQLPDAIYDDTKFRILASRKPAEVDLDGLPRRWTFLATGSVLRFKGWLWLTNRNHSTSDKEGDSESDDNAELPDLNADDPLKLARLDVLAKETKPPSRYNQASLIRALEKEGIGRPATYAQIMDTIMSRGYVEERERKLFCTELGLGLIDILKQGFADHFIELEFTRNVESALDKVAEGAEDWQRLVISFRDEIERKLAGARTSVSPIQALIDGQQRSSESRFAPPEDTGASCPACGKANVMRHNGRNGEWLACASKSCKYTAPVLTDTQRFMVEKVAATLCPKCGGPMSPKASVKNDRLFLSCLQYPECNGAAPVPGSEGTVSAASKASGGGSGGKRKAAGSRSRSAGGGEKTGRAPARKKSSKKVSKKASTRKGSASVKATPGQGEPVSCPVCDATMVVRKGKNGDFYGCTRYPNCRGTLNIG